MGGCGLDSSGSGEGKIAGYFEKCEEQWCSIKCSGFIDLKRYSKFLKWTLRL
jgi:hypothetical protein